MLLIGPFETNFIEINITKKHFSLKENVIAKYGIFYLGLNVLIQARSSYKSKYENQALHFDAHDMIHMHH